MNMKTPNGEICRTSYKRISRQILTIKATNGREQPIASKKNNAQVQPTIPAQSSLESRNTSKNYKPNHVEFHNP
jgi:hypothetical protein